MLYHHCFSSSIFRIHHWKKRPRKSEGIGIEWHISASGQNKVNWSFQNV